MWWGREVRDEIRILKIYENIIKIKEKSQNNTTGVFTRNIKPMRTGYQNHNAWKDKLFLRVIK